MNFQRSSGVLLHPTSFPGPYGIGDLGPQAYRFIGFLAESGTKLWQVLPLSPTGYGDSPYQSFSAFAGNPYLISPDLLLKDDLLHPDDLVDLPDFPVEQIDFGRAISWKLNLLERAFIRFTSERGLARRDFDIFYAQNAAWLDDYALFMAIKESQGGGSWAGWPAELRQRDAAALAEARQSLEYAISRFTFYQFIFFRQWDALRSYANERDVCIIGDIPIFVAYDSADVWSNPDLFHLDDNGIPTVVAGVPPDYFSPTGQLWGNPLYRWDEHRASNYDWWIARFRAILQMVDIVRLDHFRGFAAYWEVPAGNLTAEVGRWVPAPGDDFFGVLRDAIGDTEGKLPILAEDLGEITPDVIALRDKFDLPGMKILQFAFSGPDNQFLPHYYSENCVVYTGTHDNDTVRGWYDATSEHERDFARRYMSVDGSDIAWNIIRAAWHSSANLALAAMQDLLSLGGVARMNFPGHAAGNWGWRMREDALNDELKMRLGELNRASGR